MSALTYRERPPAGDPAGLLVLHHGRGAGEHTCSASPTPSIRSAACTSLRRALADHRRLAGPSLVHGPSRRLADPGTFHAAYDKVAAFHDELWERIGIAPRVHRVRRLLDGPVEARFCINEHGSSDIEVTVKLRDPAYVSAALALLRDRFGGAGSAS